MALGGDWAVLAMVESRGHVAIAVVGAAGLDGRHGRQGSRVIDQLDLALNGSTGGEGPKSAGLDGTWWLGCAGAKVVL